MGGASTWTQLGLHADNVKYRAFHNVLQAKGAINVENNSVEGLRKRFLVRNVCNHGEHYESPCVIQ